jgi:hypothetical protein
VLLTLAAFSSFVAIDFRLDSLEKKTTQMIETATTSELPVVWMETEVATGDTIYDFCAAAFESDVMECVQTFVLLNQDRFSSAIGNERDLWLVSTASYIIPIRLARSE